MNERIKDLVKQHGVNITIDGLGYGEGNIESLVELIVRECAQVLETNGDNQRTIRMTESTGHNKTTDWMEGYEEAVNQYGGYLLKKNAKQIKQHFGVEE